MKSNFFVLLLIINLLWYPELSGCTGIYMKSGNKVLAGNNEDGSNPETKIRVIPGKNGSYGKIYFGYNDLSPQGGINEKGLWFDAFGLPFKPVKSDLTKYYPGDLQDKLMSECATVADVISMLDVYNRSAMTRYQWIFGDREGNSIIIEGDTIIYLSGSYQLITNFRQSQFPSGKGYECNRYQIAGELLKAQTEPGIELFRDILEAAHSEGEDVTLYSYIADLTDGLVYVYYFHNFNKPVVLDIKKELSVGEHTYNIPEMFPRNNAAESFGYWKKDELKKRIETKRFKAFDAGKYPVYYGHYIINDPEFLAEQVIDISQGPDCLYLQLNNGGPYSVIPVSGEAFALVGYGGLELSCRFNIHGDTREVFLEGGPVAIRAVYAGH